MSIYVCLSPEAIWLVAYRNDSDIDADESSADDMDTAQDLNDASSDESENE